MSTSGAGKTLADRARRVLGLNLDSGSGDDPEAVTPAKTRAEQVAVAQKRHRKRTQSYIQALEQEVLRLRRRTQALNTDLPALREEPSKAPSDASGENDSSILDSFIPEESARPQETTTVDLTTFMNGANEEPRCSLASTQLLRTDPDGSITTADAAPDETMHIEVAQARLTPQLGVDFILRLERPCLGHVQVTLAGRHPEHMDPNVPFNYSSQHSYNLSSRMYTDAAARSPRGTTPDIHELTFTVEQLDDLNRASDRLQLVDELTPVQVWGIVRKLGFVVAIDLVALNGMCSELAHYTYCNSFGTAIPTAVVKTALEVFLGWTHTEAAARFASLGVL